MDSRDCSLACDLLKNMQETPDKLTFLKDNCPVFNGDDSIGSSSEQELQCILCLLNQVIDALENNEYWCSNREVIRLVMFRSLVENTISLRHLQAEVDELTSEQTDPKP